MRGHNVRRCFSDIHRITYIYAMAKHRAATWRRISPAVAGSAIAVAASDPNIIYAGTGEVCTHRDIEAGDGVYKSTDAGKTWKNIGLNGGKTWQRPR